MQWMDRKIALKIERGEKATLPLSSYHSPHVPTNFFINSHEELVFPFLHFIPCFFTYVAPKTVRAIRMCIINGYQNQILIESSAIGVRFIDHNIELHLRKKRVKRHKKLNYVPGRYQSLRLIVPSF